MAQYPNEWEAQKAIKAENKELLEKLPIEIGELTAAIEVKAASIKTQKETLSDMRSELENKKAQYLATYELSASQ